MRKPITSVCVHPIRTRVRQTGLWCDRCALPSGVVAEILLLVAHRTTRYAQFRVCIDCGRAVS